jgi:hypothetical protein
MINLHHYLQIIIVINIYSCPDCRVLPVDIIPVKKNDQSFGATQTNLQGKTTKIH